MPSRLPSLNGLRAFEATARHMSFQAAAEELSVTPSALSYQVRSLEDSLGVKLFKRLNRAIELTHAGERLYPGVRDGFRQFELALDRMKPETPDNILVLSTGPAFAAKWLTPRVYRFVDRHPELEIRISANLKLSDLAAEQIDLGVRYGNGKYPGLEVERLCAEWVTPMISPRLLAEAGPIVEPKDLARLPLLHDGSMEAWPDTPKWKEWFEAARVEGVDPDKGLRFNHADHAFDAAIEGAGIVMGRSVLCSGDLRHGRLLTPFPHIRLDTGLYYHLVYLPGDRDKPKIRAVRDWILEEMADDPISSGRAFPAPNTSRVQRAY